MHNKRLEEIKRKSNEEIKKLYEEGANHPDVINAKAEEEKAFKYSPECKELMKKHMDNVEEALFFGKTDFKMMNATTAPEDVQEDYKAEEWNNSEDVFLERISELECENAELRAIIQVESNLNDKLHNLFSYLEILSRFDVDKFNIFKEVGRVTAEIEMRLGIDPKVVMDKEGIHIKDGHTKKTAVNANGDCWIDEN